MSEVYTSSGESSKEQKRRQLEEALADAPDFSLREGATQEQWDEALFGPEGQGEGFYDREGMGMIGQTAQDLARLLNKAKQAAEAAGQEFVPDEDLIQWCEDTVNVDGHSGLSFGAARAMAQQYGENVKEIYQTVYPEKESRTEKVRKGAKKLANAVLTRLGVK